MGLFDGLFMMKDIISSGIEAYKASERLEELCEKANENYENVLTPQEKNLYANYKKLEKKKDETTDQEESNKMMEEVEAAMVAFLLAAKANPSVSSKFRKECDEAIAEWKRANDAGGITADIIEKYAMKEAKTEEEREEIRRQLEEIGNEK